MSSDERLERIEQNLEMLIKIHLDNDREYHLQFERMQEEQRARSRVLDDRFATLQGVQEQQAVRTGEIMDAINRLYHVGCGTR
jgi:hypothetical protein